MFEEEIVQMLANEGGSVSSFNRLAGCHTSPLRLMHQEQLGNLK